MAGRTYGGVAPDERRRVRRQLLVETAQRMIGGHGLGALTITSLCAESTVAARYFYDEFGSIDQLLIVLYDSLTDDSLAALAAVDEELSGADPLTQIRGLVAAYVGWMLVDPLRAQVFIELVSVGGELAHRRRQANDRFAAFIAGWYEARNEQVASPPGTYFTAFLVGGVERAVERWIVSDAQTADDLTEDLVFVFTAVWEKLQSEGGASRRAAASTKRDRRPGTRR